MASTSNRSGTAQPPPVVPLAEHWRDKHFYVIGQTGVGKSRFLEHMILQDIEQANGVGVLDVAEDLFNHVLYHIAKLSLSKPEIVERIAIIDPLDERWTAGINPLETAPGDIPHRRALALTDAMISIWDFKPNEAPRMTRLLNNSVMALAAAGLTLVYLRRFLREDAYRQQVLSRINESHIADYFLQEFPKTEAGQAQWVAPILNKIEPFLFDPDLRLIFEAGATINFRSLMDNHGILLVNLAKGRFTTYNSNLLGAFIMSQIQQAAASRSNTTYRVPFYLYLDEFQNYTTGDMETILSEARKFNLCLTLAHQFVHQLPEIQRQGILNNAGTIACFRVGYQDAEILAHELFPALMTRWHAEARMVHTRPLPTMVPNFTEETITHAEKVSWIQKLAMREFLTKHRGERLPRKARSFDMPDPKWTPELIDAKQRIIETAGRRFGRLKSEVRAAPIYVPNKAAATRANPISKEDNDFYDPKAEAL
jgi:hypothetical protein